MILFIILLILFAYIDIVFYLRKLERRACIQTSQLITINGTMYFWNALIKYVFCSLVGISLRFLQDRKAEPKPDWAFQLMAGLACSYLAYIVYDYYKLKIIPLELFIILVGWLGAYIVKTLDYVAKNGIIIYLRKIAEDFLAFSKERTK